MGSLVFHLCAVFRANVGIPVLREMLILLLTAFADRGQTFMKVRLDFHIVECWGGNGVAPD